MKIYPNSDVCFYVEKPGCWGSYLKHGPHHSWKLPEKYFRPRYMYYWIDSEGAKMRQVETDNLYFKDWPKNRIRPQACLGMLYATGYRFIRLTMAPPANFKCAPLPVNLETALKVNVLLIEKAKAEKLALKKKKDEEKAKKKAELAYKNRTKKKGRS